MNESRITLGIAVFATLLSIATLFTALFADLPVTSGKAKEIATEQAPSAIGPYSQAIKKNGFLFVAGQIAIDPSEDEIMTSVKSQTEQVMKNIEAILEEAGLSMDNIVKSTVMMTNIGDYSTINDVYESHFSSEKPYPARSAFEVQALPNEDAKVEIEVIAAY